MRFTSLILAATLLNTSGCATSPIGSGEARDGSLISNRWQEPGADTGQLIVTRDSGFMGGACSQRVYVSGTPIADLRSGKKVTVYLPAGRYVVGVRPNGMCGGGSASAELQMVAGGNEVYRIASGQSGDLKIEPSAF